jgi:hypothetical protein
VDSAGDQDTLLASLGTPWTASAGDHGHTRAHGDTTLGRERHEPLPAQSPGLERAHPGPSRHFRRAAAEAARDGWRARRSASSAPPAISGWRRRFSNHRLFARGVGEATDIVRKEMYTFDDGGGRSVTLRPEARRRVPTTSSTACTSRSRSALVPRPFFRREAPQKGRYRQFFQVGAEALGSRTRPSTPRSCCCRRAVRGAADPHAAAAVEPGQPGGYAAYREQLVAFLRAHPTR